MILKSISRITEGCPFSLLCKVEKVRVGRDKRFLVLRVKDYTKCVVHFRKFNLSNLEQEIYGNGPVEVRKIPSKLVDIVVSFPPEEVIPSLQRGVVVCIHNLECRSVPCSNYNIFIYELYVNAQLGGQLLVMPCDDLRLCWKERLFRGTENEKFPYIGTITIAEIRKGTSFSLMCEVVQCGRKSNTDQVVLRVRDSTLAKIYTKKYDLDNLDSTSQSNEEVCFYKGGSPVLDVVVTCLSRDIGEMNGEIVSLGPVVCDSSPFSVPHPASRAIHTLCVDATHPSFQLVTRSAKEQATMNLRRKLNSKPPKKRKRRKRSRHEHSSLVNLESCEGSQGAVGVSSSSAVEFGLPDMSQESVSSNLPPRKGSLSESSGSTAAGIELIDLTEESDSSNLPPRRRSHSDSSGSTVSDLELTNLSQESGSSNFPLIKIQKHSESSDSSVLDLEKLEISQEVVASDSHPRRRKPSESGDVIVLDVDLFDSSDSSSR